MNKTAPTKTAPTKQTTRNSENIDQHDPELIRDVVRESLAEGLPAETFLDAEGRQVWAKMQQDQGGPDKMFRVAVDFAFVCPAPTKKESVARAKQLISRMHEEGYLVDCSPVKATCLGE
jgi:hypothetical protein